MSKIGQKTGMSNIEKNVIIIDMTVPFVQANQNLNSGSRLANGLNSLPSLSVVGSERLGSEGSSKGDKNAIKLFNRKIPKP